MTATARPVLVVSDEPQLVRGLNIMLRSAGYVVETARAGPEALEIVAERTPEALVLKAYSRMVTASRCVRRFASAARFRS